MYPSRFEYLAPTSVEEVIAALGEREGAKVMAGGQSLIPVLKLRVASVDTVVDVNRVAGLDAIEEADGELRIGALVRHVSAERSPLLTKRYGLLGATARLVADPLVRNRGTICGSLAHADPQGDWGSAMLAARGSVVARGPDGERTIPVDELALGPFMTTLQPDEMITEVRVPDPGPRTGGTYLKLERKVGDFATAAVAVQVTLDNGNVGQVGHRADRGRRDEPARERRRGRASRQRADRRGDRATPRGSPPRRRSRNPTTAAPLNTRGTSCASSASAAFALRSRPRRPGRSDGHDPARIPHRDRPPHGRGHRQRAGPLGRGRGAAAARALPPPDARAHRDAHRLRHDELRCLRRARRRDAGQVLHDARRPGERRRDHDRRGSRRGRSAAPDPAGLPRGARPAVRLLHARG